MASQPGAPGGEIKKETLAGIQGRLIVFLRRVRMSEWGSVVGERPDQPVIWTGRVGLGGEQGQWLS